MSEIPNDIKAVVDGRDSQRCVRCGKHLSNNGSRHHRQRRQVGGHVVANIVLLCGSGTTGCHGWAHSHPNDARREGLIVHTRVEDVSSVPIRILDVDRAMGHIYVYLTVDGQREDVDHATASVRLAEVA